MLCVFNEKILVNYQMRNGSYFYIQVFCARKWKWGVAEEAQLLNPSIKMYKMIDTSKHKCQVLDYVKDVAG